MNDVRVLSLVNNVAKTSFESELSIKLDASTDIDVAIASLYDTSRDDIEIEGGVGETEFIPLGAERRFDISAYKKLKAEVERFDILHTHYNFSGSMARLLCSLSDTKIVNTEHADHRYYSYLQRFASFPTFAFTDAMVFNSQNTRDSLAWYERLLVEETNSYIIYNGVDANKIDRAESVSEPTLPEGRVIVSAGRMVPVKNLDSLIHAFEIINSAHPDTSLVLIGDGPERSNVGRLSEKLGISDSVYFPGYLSRERVYSAMHRADIFAVPSYREGFCNAAVEAMSCGLPIVASDIDVLHEVVGEGGRFADPHSSEAIADVLESLLQSDDERRSVGSTARERAREMFPIERSVEEYSKVYRSVLRE